MMVNTMRLLMFVIASTITSGFAQKSYANVQEIAAVVNEDAVSMRDLNKRLKLIMASSGLRNTQDIREKMTPQVLDALVNEQIMLQEARKLGLSVSQKEIDQGFATIAGQNKMKPAQFKAMLERGGVDVSTMLRQIEAQLAWTKVVQARVRPRVTISERDIEASYERIKSKIGTTEYLTAEIYLPVDNETNEGTVKQLANRLVSEIKSNKASFFKLAQQFSKAAGSMNGGDTGWLNEEQIDPDILESLQSIKKNQVTRPVKTLEGYHIMFLRDTRTLTEDTMPSREQIHYNLGTERLEKLQRRHLMDLRASSFVDVRV